MAAELKARIVISFDDEVVQDLEGDVAEMARGWMWPETFAAFREAMQEVHAAMLHAASNPGEYGLARKATPGYRDSLSDHQAWREEAEGGALRISIVPDPREAEISEGEVAPFDMKPGLLSGPNAKVGESGRYNTVMFRHATPGTAGRAGKPMPKEIHDVAKKLKGYRTMGDLWNKGKSDAATARAALKAEGETLTPQGAVSRGADGQREVRNIFGKRGAPGALTKIEKSWTGYEHTASIYSGMRRYEKLFAESGARQTTGYRTFRRVSDNSDDEAWVHPGLPENPICDTISELMHDSVVDAVDIGIERDIEAMLEYRATGSPPS